MQPGMKPQLRVHIQVGGKCEMGISKKRRASRVCVKTKIPDPPAQAKCLRSFVHSLLIFEPLRPHRESSTKQHEGLGWCIHVLAWHKSTCTFICVNDFRALRQFVFRHGDSLFGFLKVVASMIRPQLPSRRVLLQSWLFGDISRRS